MITDILEEDPKEFYAEYMVLLEPSRVLTGYRRFIVVNGKLSIEVEDYSLEGMLRPLSEIDNLSHEMLQIVETAVDLLWEVLVDCNEYDLLSTVRNKCFRRGMSIRFRQYHLH